jgi:hypothetical protein
MNAGSVSAGIPSFGGHPESTSSNGIDLVLVLVVSELEKNH